MRGPDRKPIAKALVAAVVDSGSVNRWTAIEAPVSTRTGPDGRFRLTLRAAQAYRVRVEAPGVAPAFRKNVSAGASLTFDLTRGGTIEGVVRDGDTGQPVPRARVTAGGPEAIALPDDPDAGRVVTTSDEAGRFKLDGLGIGLHTVTARSRMAGYAALSNVRLGARIELLVFPAASVSGTIVGPDGRPAPRAVVSAFGRRPSGGAAASETADEAGRYELLGLSAGAYEVIARAAGFAPGVASDVVLERRSEARVDLTLRPGVRVVGRLVDTNDRPAPGRIGVGELDGQPTPFALADSLRGEAGADGRFAIENVPIGEHALGVAAPGFAPKRVEVSARAGAPQVDVGDVRLDVGLAIRGRVRTTSGAPVADAIVRGFAMRRGVGPAEAETLTDGSFTLAGLDQLVYNLTVRAPGFGFTERRAEPGGDPVEITLSPAGTITGQVVDERGRPVESFRVTAVASDESGGMGPPLRTAPRSEEVTSDDGRFALGDLAAGTYVVNASAPERADGSIPGVAVSAGGAVDVGAIKLPSGGIVKGTVADASGAPIAGARISVSGEGESWFSFGDEPQATSDGSGAFEVKGVAAGRAQVTASHPSYARTEAVAAEVDPAKPPVDLRIVMTQGGRIEGSVRRRDGAPMPSLLVNASGTTMMFGQSMRDSSATTGPDGSFVIEHVAPGRSRVTVMPAGRGGVFQSGLRREVEVRDGETTTVELVLREILISGTVTRAGAPAAGLRIEAMADSQFLVGGGRGMNVPPPAASGPQRMFAVTRDDGGYEMIVDEPGRVRLNVTTADGRTRLPMRSVEVPDADAFAFDIAYAGAPVSGVVVDKETDAPIAYVAVLARPKAGQGPFGSGSGASGADGRFQLEVEPGEYVLEARAREADYGQAEQAVSIGEGGIADVRLALPKGLGISGRITDGAGRGVPGIDVRAMSADGGGPGWGWSQSLADGSFSIGSLKTGPHTLVAESRAGLFAVRPGVAAGTKAVGLTLQPGGRVIVGVEGPGGEPIFGAWPDVSHVGGLPVGNIGRPRAPTDAQGEAEVLVPAGDLTIEVRKGELRGHTTVSVASGETARAHIRLQRIPASGGS